MDNVTHVPRADETVRTVHQMLVQAGAELERLLTPAPTIPTPTPPQEMTSAQQQARTLAAIASLVASYPDMPPVSWMVSDVAPGRAVGQVHNESDALARNAITVWADLLGSEVTQSRSGDDTWTVTQTSTSSGGVDFRIWSMVDRTPERAKSDG
jgi:hypothetical protein